ncbi:MAG TPA: DUF6569 family protein [Puia sp.]|nr:DUF6569 family protein [Puia sp.]
MRCLLSLCFSFLLLSASAQITYETVYVDYDSSWLFRNLKIIPIRHKGGGGMPGSTGMDVVPLGEALSKGLVTVTERGTTSFENVHWLRFNTKSNKSVYIGGGEIITGGRQDRMIVRDTILNPSEKDQYVPVMCVEEGRWSEKEKKFGYGNYANSDLRKTLDSGKNQVLIWHEIDRQLQEGKFKNTTFAYESKWLDKKYVLQGEDYFKFFMDKFRRSDSTIVGFIALSGDKVIGSDVFDGTYLFYHQLEPLLRGYIDEALSGGAPVTVQETAVRRYADKLLKDEKTQEEFVKDNGKIFRMSGHVFHINTFVKEPM